MAGLHPALHCMFAGTHIYTGVERGTVRISVSHNECNAMSLARTAQSRDECTNHEATALPLKFIKLPCKLIAYTQDKSG